MKWYYLFAIPLIILIIGCSQATDNNVPERQSPDTRETDTKSEENINEPIKNQETTDTGDSNWMDIELKDVTSKEMFKISDFKGKKILLESFAVWCPTCTKQQNELKKFHTEIGDDVVTINLDTDPNEDEQKVIDHVNKNGYDWRYAVSPTDLTRSLIDEFGVGIVNAPSTPVILICEDGSSRQLPSGFKSTEKLKSELAKGC